MSHFDQFEAEFRFKSYLNLEQIIGISSYAITVWLQLRFLTTYFYLKQN